MIVHIVYNVPLSRVLDVNLKRTLNSKQKSQAQGSKYKDSAKTLQPLQGGRSALKTFVHEVGGSRTSDDEGGISDYNEQNGEEGRYASESPVKGKRRVTSSVSFQRLIYLTRALHHFFIRAW